MAKATSMAPQSWWILTLYTYSWWCAPMAMPVRAATSAGMGLKEVA